MILHLLVPRVGDYNIGKVKKVVRMGRVKGVERIEMVKEMEEAIREIR